MENENHLNADVGVFPIRESVNAKITSHALTKENLIYTTDVSISTTFTKLRLS